MQESNSNTNTKFSDTLGDTVQSYDRYEVNPRSNQYNQVPSETSKATSSDFNSKLDQNLHKMCGKISRYNIKLDTYYNIVGFLPFEMTSSFYIIVSRIPNIKNEQF